MTSLHTLAPRNLGLLDQQLPDRPYGVEEWHFATDTPQHNFVKIENFSQGGEHLPLSVTLGIRTAPKAGLPAKQTPLGARYATEHVYDPEGGVLGTVHLDRLQDDSWRAVLSFAEGTPVCDSRGTVGAVTPDDAIVAAVTAIWRHAMD